MWVQKQKLSDVVMNMSLDFVVRISRATICGVVLKRDVYNTEIYQIPQNI